MDTLYIFPYTNHRRCSLGTHRTEISNSTVKLMLLPLAKWSRFHENEKIDFPGLECILRKVTKKFIHGWPKACSIRASLFIILTLYGG